MPVTTETPVSVAAQIASLSSDVRNGLDRATLQGLLPPGAARNALDCALWDFEAKRAGRPVWELAGLGEPGSVQTAFTLSADSPGGHGTGCACQCGQTHPEAENDR